MKLDKIAHFLVGYCIAITLSFILTIPITILISAFIAIGKEIYDRYFNGTVDPLDAIATIIGSLIACLVFAILK